MEEKNNPMPQIPGIPVVPPVAPVVDEPKVVVPKVETPKEETPVKLSWKKPIIKILIIGVVAVVIYLLIKR